MMKQYEAAKRACPDALLLFRMGDFYEMFHEDAKTAARVLNLALTSRDKGENGTPMAGFPHHQLESYLGKLIAAGFRAAVCEQVEDPKLAKGLVKREVTRVVTPGTITDDALLDPRESNYLAAVSPGDPVGLAWVEISTGRFVAAHFPAAQLPDQLARIAPAECLLAEDSAAFAAAPRRKMLVTRRPGWAFSLETARQNLLKHFRTNNLEGFGFATIRATTRPCAPRRRDRLSQRDAKNLAGTRRSPAVLSQFHGPGDRRSRAAAAWRSRGRSARAAATARSWPCSIAPSRRWAPGFWPIGWPTR